MSGVPTLVVLQTICRDVIVWRLLVVVHGGGIRRRLGETSLQGGGIHGRIILRPYKEYIHANTPHGKGLGVGASVRTLPGAGKERLSERSEF